MIELLVASNCVKKAVINKVLASKYAKIKDDDSLFMSYSEALVFLEYIKDDDLYEAFYLTLLLALRRSELLGIKWGAINFIKKKLSINHTVTKGTKVNRLNSTKTTDSKRVYPLDDELGAEILSVFISLKERREKETGKEVDSEEYVFLSSKGTPFYPDTLTRNF